MAKTEGEFGLYNFRKNRFAAAFNALYSCDVINDHSPLKNPPMNKVEISNTINFQYGSTTARPDPAMTLTVTANDQSIVLKKNEPAQSLDNVSFFKITVNDQFFPLSLFFDGQQFCSPELSPDGVMMATTPLSSGKDISATLYSQSDSGACGMITVNFTSSADGIGVVIVGTSGLTDSEA